MSSARRDNPARLLIAVSVSSMLAVFLLYTSLAGSTTRSLTPRTVIGQTGEVAIAGLVAGPVRGDAHDGDLQFTLEEIGGTAKVAVRYRGSVPDLFKVGRHVFLRGSLKGRVFEAVPGSLVTKCPSKYVADKETTE